MSVHQEKIHAWVRVMAFKSISTIFLLYRDAQFY